jgi:hypothetical protein
MTTTSFPPNSRAAQLGYTPEIAQSDVPARCPAWCTVADHSDEPGTEDVQHVGPRLAPLEVPVGIRGRDADRLLEVEILAWTNSDGSPQRPLAWVQPSAETCEGSDMTPAGLRELARRVRAHAAAMESLADELEELRR